MAARRPFRDEAEMLAIAEEIQEQRVDHVRGQDGPDDAQASAAGDVGDYVVQQQVHLLQGFLHVLDVGGCVFHEPLPLTQIGPQGRNLGIRAEAPA